MSDPWTYFGVWSKAKCTAVCELLRQLGARFEIFEEVNTEDRLKNWEAWDPAATDPFISYNLYIHDDDLKIVGTRIVEAFPERQFGYKGNADPPTK